MAQMLRLVKRWRTEGWGGPPPYLIKRAMLLAECKRIDARWFVETGTYMGDTLWFMQPAVSNLVSIEVQPDLAALAQRRFRGHPHVKIVNGDSAVELANIVKQIDCTCLFWLDGHYSAGMTGRGIKDCPIFEELAAISTLTNHRFSIMIDDARCFGTDPAYPSVEDLRDEANKLFLNHEFAIWNDIIHLKSCQSLHLEAMIANTPHHRPS